MRDNGEIEMVVFHIFRTREGNMLVGCVGRFGSRVVVSPSVDRRAKGHRAVVRKLVDARTDGPPIQERKSVLLHDCNNK